MATSVKPDGSRRPQRRPSNKSTGARRTPRVPAGGAAGPEGRNGALVADAPPATEQDVAAQHVQGDILTLPPESEPTAVPVGQRLDVRLARSVGAPWLTREVGIYGGLLLLSLVMRLVLLADKPLHHDESLHATYSWYLYRGRGYTYDPMMHGPFQFHLTALVFFLFGVSEFTARLLPALFGTAIVALPWFLRKELGRAGALFLAIMLSLSPSFLYFSRFERNDIYIAFFTLAMVALFFRFLDRPRHIHVILLGAVWALSFTAKENTFITAFVFGLFVLGVLARELAMRPASGSRPLIDAVRSVGIEPFLFALATFGIIFAVLFTTVFTHPQGLLDGLTKSIQYWLSQQPVARGSQPWYFYSVIMPAYEPLAILFGLAAGGLAAVRRTYWAVFLVWFAVGSLAVYSWAGEKMPWLVLHTLLPFLLLSAWMLNWVWERRRALGARIALGVAALLSIYMVHSATLLSYVNYANPVELLVYVQSSTDVLDAMDQINTVARRSGQGYMMPIVVDSHDSWPFVWYLRDYKAVSYPASVTGPQTAPVVVVSSDTNAQVQPLMSDYQGTTYKLRIWWVQQPLNQADMMKWFRWAMWREAWNPLGSYDFNLYIKRDLAAGP